MNDNTALNKALGAGLPVLSLFIFDTNITDELSADDPRINFIYESLCSINDELVRHGSSILIVKGDPAEEWKKLITLYDVSRVYYNKDYEPYATRRDNGVKNLLNLQGIGFEGFKDQVIFEEKEVTKKDGLPYTVFTPYRNSWIQKYSTTHDDPSGYRSNSMNFLSIRIPYPSLEKLGFKPATVRIKPYDLGKIDDYEKHRDFPAADATTHLGPHLRFGTVSIRAIAKLASIKNTVFLGELIWREFFMQILSNFPYVVTGSFRKKYDNIQWRNNEGEFRRWCDGVTGYPMVDAGMRQLNETGYMHNRVRMITAGFLCKHLLIDWRWGEAYFAEKLHDYELSSNNGNWQWAAGTGCDAAPYFRIFNPLLQQKKFDPAGKYISAWIGELHNGSYPAPVTDHETARIRAIDAYNKAVRM